MSYNRTLLIHKTILIIYGLQMAAVKNSIICYEAQNEATDRF